MSASARRRYLLLILLATGLLLGPRAYPRWREAWQRHRAARFDADAIRLTAYPVTRDNWLVFDIPRQTDALRVLTNAAVQGLVPPDTTREQPREGWRYAIDYALLDRAGQTLAERRYHLRTSVISHQDPATGEVQGITWFRNSNWNPTMTRTIQLPLNPGSAARFQLRLAPCEPEVQEVVIRVLARRERSNFDQPYAWSRLSERARARLSRASVYPPTLLTLAERCNLLRWNWSALPPTGLEGRDYDLRILYQRENTIGEEPDDLAMTDGLLLREDLHHTLPLPPGPARVVLECARAGAARDDRPTEVWVQWYPDTPKEPEVHHGLLHASPQTIECRADGGLLEIYATAPIVCRATWYGSAGPPHDPGLELEFPLLPLCCYLAGPDLPLDYSVAHVDRWPTPFRLDLRRLLPEPSQHPAARVPQSIEPAIVKYSLLDAQGQVLREGQLSTAGDVSVYDQTAPNTMALHVTEPARFYFALSADVKRLRIEAPHDTVTVAAFTRPPDLARVQRLPEEQQSYSRLDSDQRTWFLLQPDDADLRLAQNQTCTVYSGVRPPQRDQQILSGLYQWEDFEPAGFWKGRFLLTPRDSQSPLRPESISSTYGELTPNRDHEVDLIAEPGADWIEPRLIYSVRTPAAQDVQLWLDGALWYGFRTRAPRGEVNLPTMPAPHQPTRHTLRIDAEDGTRLLLRNLLAPGSTRYSKQLARQFDQGQLQFTVVKRTHAAEVLILRPFFPEGWSNRVSLRVSILDLPMRTGGPFDSWTLALRQFEVLPQTDQASLILQQDTQRVDGGQRCFLSLGADLPPGPYRVDVRLVDHAPAHAYATLYRLIPGRAPARKVELTDAFPWPEGWSATPGASTISTSLPELEERSDR